MLGNEVVSEVWANGKKGKTFVSAAGSRIAYQSAHASETANLNEAVIFEYSDASGMSQRTTNRTGAAVATGDGGDGSPVETDPFGGNVGTTTPYIESGGGGGYTPSPEFPMLQLYLGDSPYYINGQQASATLDGFPISFGRAIDMLASGSANINFATTSSYVLSQLGIFAVWQPNSGRNPPTSSASIGSERNGTINMGGASVDGGVWNYYFSNVSWFVPRQTQQKTPIDREFVDSLRPFLKLALARESCKNFIEKHVGGENLLDAFDNLLKQNGLVQVSRKDNDPYAAFAVGSIARGTAEIRFNYNPNPFPAKSFIGPWIATRMLVETLIHELIHLVDKGGDDNQMATRLYESGVSKTPPPNKSDYDKFGKHKVTGRSYSFASSNTWAGFLKADCLPTSDEFRKWWKTGGEE